MRRLAEIHFFQNGFTVANPVFDLFNKLQGSNLFESNLKKLPGSERSSVNSYLSSHVCHGYYNIMERKLRSKDKVEKLFKVVKSATQSDKDAKFEVIQKKLRTLKIMMCHDYCKDILSKVYCDSIKLQILVETDRLRKRIYMMPKDSIFLDLFPPKHGEHFFAAYNQDHIENLPTTKEGTVFYSQADNRIYNFWRLPTFQEVISLQIDHEAFKEANMASNFFSPQLQQQIHQSTINDVPMVEYLEKLNLHEAIMEKLPKLTYTDSRDIDAVAKEKLRLVEFAEAYDYVPGSKVLRYLKYWKAVSNIYDLEFFINKLASSAFTIANVEKMVLAGVNFYDEGDDALFGDLNDEESSEEEDFKRKSMMKKKKKSGEEDRFDEEGHKPLKNALANIVAEKIAEEKREKMQLMQDLESIKDKFLEYGAIMKKQEMASSLTRSEAFLNEIHQITYSGVLFILYQMQENYFKEKKGQKEIQTINEVIQNLSHQQDLKVTFQNGFHVNYAITALDRLDIDASVFKQEYDSFFKLTQPIIDENALNPAEFNLIAGIYLNNAINLKTFKKNVPYGGHLYQHDYKCLDFALTNISKDIRKYITTNLGSIEMTLQSFIQAKLKLNEKEYESNPSVYSQILQEKKTYLRLQIKARQSRRIYMMIMSKQMIPMDIQEYNRIHQLYHDEINWKLVHHMDYIQNNRNAAHEREQASMQKKNPGGVVQASMKMPKESPVLKSYDSACSEIEVVQQELQKYMIQISFEMFDREASALARAFEMTDVKIQAYVHPSQQFASTLNSKIDSKSHLDIINKVAPIQKMLTQIKNRCLEIETLTSGTGIVISSKDLNECLEECCRQLIKYSEIEMRNRQEHLYTDLLQYENLIYIKDRQLLNLENKLHSAKVEMNKIINTKVFSRGNNLIYELDMTNRQIRLIKDNIFLLEKNLTEKIKLCYDRELDQTRMLLSDFRKQFSEYQQSVSAKIRAEVREEVNTIDGVMKKKANHYKDLGQKTKN